MLGFPGEKVDLRFVGRSQLAPGKVLLYRKHRDVHSQLPPESLSVSLNILAVSPASDLLDQYRFDLERSEVARIVNPSSLDALVRLAAHFGGGNGQDLIADFAERHPSHRIRFAAVQALDAGEALDGRIAVYERAAGGSGLVAALARAEAEKLAKGRAWIEARPEAA